MGIKVVPTGSEPKKEKKQKGVKDTRAWVIAQLEKEGVTANLNASTGSLMDVLEQTRATKRGDVETGKQYVHGGGVRKTKLSDY